jgi:integrase
MTQTTKIKLTAERLDNLKRPAKGEINIHDNEVPGLSVRLRPKGAGQFIVRYRIKGVANPKRLTLGVIGVMGLKDARQAAREAITLAKGGTDPAKARAAHADGEGGATLGDIINSYEVEQKAGQIRHAVSDAALLRREFKKLLQKPVKSLTRRDFVDVIKVIRAGMKKDGKAVVAARPALAGKAQTLMHGALEQALGDGVIETNVISGLRAKRGSRKQKNIAQSTKKARALSLEELAALWRACDDARTPAAFGRAVQFLILTGCRRNEAALACRDWLKRAKGEPASVTLPNKITKNGLAHTVFVPALFDEKLKAFLATHNESLLFPGRRSRNTGEVPPISGWSKRWPALRAVASDYGLTREATLHDLRRSLRTGYEALGVSPRVAERQLNHVATDKLDAAYNQHDYKPERIEAANLWAQALASAIDENDANHLRAAA